MQGDGLGRLHVLIGLPGSGKTTLVEQLVRERGVCPVDDFQGGAILDRPEPWWSRKMLKVFDGLRSGQETVVADIRFCDRRELRDFVGFFAEHLPGLEVDRTYFEKAPSTCKWNVEVRARPGWREEVLSIDEWAARYDPPADAIRVHRAKKG